VTPNKINEDTVMEGGADSVSISSCGNSEVTHLIQKNQNLK
jgi:hypothetical protein